MIWLWKHDEPPRSPVMTVPRDTYETALQRLADAQKTDGVTPPKPTPRGTDDSPQP